MGQAEKHVSEIKHRGFHWGFVIPLKYQLQLNETVLRKDDAESRGAEVGKDLLHPHYLNNSQLEQVAEDYVQESFVSSRIETPQTEKLAPIFNYPHKKGFSHVQTIFISQFVPFAPHPFTGYDWEEPDSMLLARLRRVSEMWFYMHNHLLKERVGYINLGNYFYHIHTHLHQKTLKIHKENTDRLWQAVRFLPITTDAQVNQVTYSVNASPDQQSCNKQSSIVLKHFSYPAAWLKTFLKVLVEPVTTTM